jgi:hypothetical protein
MLSWHVPGLAWRARVPSGDPLFRGALPQCDARVPPVHEIPQLSGGNRLAPWPPLHYYLYFRTNLFLKLSNSGHFCVFCGIFSRRPYSIAISFPSLARKGRPAAQPNANTAVLKLLLSTDGSILAKA